MSLTEAVLLDYVQQRLFSPTQSPIPRTVGAELELIPVDTATRAAVSIPVSARAISRLAISEDWPGDAARDGQTSWNLGDGSSVSFEPGGQIEISSSPHDSASSLIRSLQRIANLLQSAMEKAGVELITLGVDPYNDLASVPLQLRRERYLKMTQYFNSVGASGVRMMRQTAALQMNVERGDEPVPRWRLLNAIAPVVTALFANSRQYAGSDTGHASYRAHLWRTLDASRTGLAYDARDPASHYLGFALDAMAIRSGGLRERGDYKSFRQWMKHGDVSLDEWEFHLSTLFPEVRPKAYFELRSADTIAIQWLAAPIVFVTGLVYDSNSARAAGDLLGDPSSTLMETAGRLGLRDARLRDFARELVRLSLAGAETLGEGYISTDDLDTARKYFSRALDGN